MSRINRYVIGSDENGRSAVLDDKLGNVQEREGYFWRATLWATAETPADNSIEGDRSLVGPRREPLPNGLLCRALELQPDDPDAARAAQVFDELSEQAGQTIKAGDEERSRHPSMHRTDTLDCITCVRGEVFLVTDVDEVKLTPGDTVVIRGTNHAWSNRSSEPCLLVGSSVAALPLGPDS
ncbi:cupin domain-containing protein [Streptomyces sp. NPDC093544]|jgi:quercetin dioxygenase-like cupin family protein|uniref:cupin domain-containing protein n=1 Tax=Streptomyces sp. NPDC093544 TaxID=3155200 RepID=UPI003445FE6D